MAVSEILGLFQTPDQYTAAQDAAMQRQFLQRATLDPFQKASVLGQQAGYSAAQGIGGALGGKDPQLEMISRRNVLLSQLNPSDPSSYIKVAEVAAQMGDPQFAVLIAQEGRKARSEVALAAQRDAAAARERLPPVNTNVQIAAEIAKLKDGITQLEAAEQTPENNRTKIRLTNTLAELERLSGTKQPDFMLKQEQLQGLKANLRVLQNQPEPNKEAIQRIQDSIEAIEGVPKEGKTPVKMGVSQNKRQVVYYDPNKDEQFVLNEGADGKQIRVSFTGSLYEKPSKDGGEGGAAGTGTVEVVDPKNPTKTIIVTKAEAEANRLTPAKAIEGLTPKMRQQLEADYPKATVSLRAYQSKSAAFIKDIEELRDSAGLDSVTGFAAGRSPGITDAGRTAVALYNKIVAKGGFQQLQDMRDMSKTGGALGNTSNRDISLLIDAFAAIDRKQSAPAVRKALDNLIDELKGSQVRVKDAYDLTYEYRNLNAPSATPANQYVEIKTLPDGRKLGKKADGTVEEIK